MLALVSREDLDQLAGYGLTVIGLSLMERGHVDRLTLAECLPQLHDSLGRQRNEVVSKVDALLLSQLSLEHVAAVHLLDESTVVVDVEIISLLNLALVKNHLDSDLTLVVLDKIVERNASLKAHEATSEVENSGIVRLDHISGDQAVIQTLPRAT